MKNYFKNLSWEDYALAAIIVVTLILNIRLMTSFKQLPSPVYGGDIYYQLGSVNNVKYGGNPLLSPNILGSEPIYSPLYSMLVGYPAMLLGIDSVNAMFFFSSIILILCALIIYLLGYSFFENKVIGLIGVIVFLPIAGYPILKYTDFTYLVIIPSFYLLFFKAIKTRSLGYVISAGVIYGISAISHGVAFIALTLFVGLSVLYFVFLKNADFKKKGFVKDKKIFWADVKTFLIIIIIGVVLAQLAWYKPIFVYHGQTQNDYIRWNQPDYSNPSYQWNFFWSNMRYDFFDYTNVFFFVTSIMGLIGLFLLLFMKKKAGRVETELILIMALAGFIGSYHYFLSEPLVHTNLVPGHIHYFLLKFAAFFGMLFCVKFIMQLTKNKLVVIIGLVLIIAVLKITAFPKVYDDQWTKAGMNPLSPDLAGVRDWVIKNSEVNDVFISTNELSFSLNALTGRKVMNSRRAHNSPYLDNDRRYLDAAIILYGNDEAKRFELIKKYEIKYLYWNEYWFNTEYYFNEKGELVGEFDPIALIYNKEYEDELKQYNISYYVKHGWIDPSLKGEFFKDYDIIYVLPKNFNLTNPWDYALNTNLKEEYAYTYQGRKVAIIYRVN